MISITTKGLFLPDIRQGGGGGGIMKAPTVPVFPTIRVIQIKDDEKEPQVIVTLIENGE